VTYVYPKNPTYKTTLNYFIISIATKIGHAGTPAGKGSALKIVQTKKRSSKLGVFSQGLQGDPEKAPL